MAAAACKLLCAGGDCEGSLQRLLCATSVSATAPALMTGRPPATDGAKQAGLAPEPTALASQPRGLPCHITSCDGDEVQELNRDDQPTQKTLAPALGFKTQAGLLVSTFILAPAPSLTKFTSSLTESSSVKKRRSLRNPERASAAGERLIE